jgi:hypothetical protein
MAKSPTTSSRDRGLVGFEECGPEPLIRGSGRAGPGLAPPGTYGVPSGGGMCPVRASPDTPFATPYGEQPIASLRVGDVVYSDDHEAIGVVPLPKVEHTSVAHHRVMRVRSKTVEVDRFQALSRHLPLPVGACERPAVTAGGGS